MQSSATVVLRTVFVLGSAAASLLVARPLGAQQPVRPDSVQAQMQQASQMMIPMMQQMAVVMLEGTLTTLAKPENAERLATFVKNYYDALLKRGFTKEQALQIVTAVGIPQTPTMR